MKQRILIRGISFIALVLMIFITSGCTSKKGYVFTEWNSYAEKVTETNSDASVISFRKKDISKNDYISGGYNFRYTVKPLKEGNSVLTLDIMHGESEEIRSKTYYFSVDSNMEITLNRSVFSYKFKKWKDVSQKIQMIVSDENILNVEEKEISSDEKELDSRTLTEFIVTGVDAGIANVTINILDENDVVVESKVYSFEIDEDLNIEYNGCESTYIFTVDASQLDKTTESLFGENIEYSKNIISRNGRDYVQYTLKALSIGNSDLLINILNGNNEIVSSKTYHFDVIGNLDIVNGGVSENEINNDASTMTFNH